ncbi:MAG: PAAR domain-containing protein [Saezia sp.]
MFFTNQHNKNIIRLGDTTDHGGKVLTAEDRMPVYGKPLARIGDMVWCPRCENQYPIVEGDETMKIWGRSIAFEGHRTGCGAKLISIAN